MSVEEFVLIPKNTYARQRPLVEQVLENPDIRSKANQLHFLSRFTKHEENSENEPFVPLVIKQKTMKELTSFSPSQLTKASLIYDRLVADTDYSVDNSGFIVFKNNPLSINTSTWLHNIQQPRKVLTADELQIVKHLKLPEHLVANTFAKRIGNESTVVTALNNKLDESFSGGEPSPKKTRKGAKGWEKY